MDLQDQRGRLAAAGIAAVCALLLYVLTAGNGPYWQDSGLYLAALHRGGGLYPPGFPLWLLLAKPFVAALGVVGVPFTYATHCFSAVWGAVAAGLVTLSVLLLATPGYRFFSPAERTAPEPLSKSVLAIGVIAGIAAGWSYSLWFQSITAEVYSLHAALAMGILYCILRLGAEGPAPGAESRTGTQRRWMWALVVVSGLSFANHPASIIWLLPLGLLGLHHRRLWSGRPQLAAGMLVAWFACGFLPYLYLPLIASTDPQTQYGHVTSLGGFLAHVAGKKFTGQGSSYGFDAWRWIHLPVQCWYELLVAGLAGLPLGAARWWRMGLGARLGLVAFAVPSVVLPLSYLQGSEYDFWLLPLWLLGWVMAGAGWVALFTRLRRPVWFAPAVGVVALLPPLWINVPLLYRGDDYVPEDFARQLLEPLDPNAIYFAISDQECSLTLYAQRVLGVRPDVAIVQKPVMTTGWYPDWLQATYPALRVPRPPAGTTWSEDEWAMHVVHANRDRTPYVSAKPLPMKLPDGEFWLPHAGLWKVHRGGAQATLDSTVWEMRYRNPDPYGRPMRPHHQQKRYAGGGWYPVRTTYGHEARSYHQQAWLNLAHFYRDNGVPDRALGAYRRLFELWPDLPVAAVRDEAAAFAAQQGDPWRPPPLR
ncbi:MAG: protein O-mannosyl-transferase family [Planctomycetota bacterium]|jgi:hypothetical protein